MPNQNNNEELREKLERFVKLDKCNDVWCDFTSLYEMADFIAGQISKAKQQDKREGLVEGLEKAKEIIDNLEYGKDTICFNCCMEIKTKIDQALTKLK